MKSQTCLKMVLALVSILAGSSLSFATCPDCPTGYTASGSTYYVGSTGGPAPASTAADACAKAIGLARVSQQLNARGGCTATGGQAWILSPGTFSPGSGSGSYGTECYCSLFSGQYYCSITISDSYAQCCVPSKFTFEQSDTAE